MKKKETIRKKPEDNNNSNSNLINNLLNNNNMFNNNKEIQEEENLEDKSKKGLIEQFKEKLKKKIKSNFLVGFHQSQPILQQFTKLFKNFKFKKILKINLQTLEYRQTNVTLTLL